MTSGVYERKLKHNKKQSKILKLLFKEGKLKPWNKGLTKENDERLKKAGEKIRKNHKGKKHSKKTIEKIRDRMKGKNNPMYGKHHSPKIKKYLKIFWKGKTGSKSNSWKGDKVGQKACHGWIREHKTPSEVCEICGGKKLLQLANVRNHVYTRNPDDYRWYCVSCHKKRDNADRFFKNFKRNAR